MDPNTNQGVGETNRAKRKRDRPSKQRRENNSADESLVGMEVSGSVKSAFGAGYLLTVTVANSGPTLRGVVFRPGHFVPLSEDNDVAPNVKMIVRREIPVPTKAGPGAEARASDLGAPEGQAVNRPDDLFET